MVNRPLLIGLIAISAGLHLWAVWPSEPRQPVPPGEDSTTNIAMRKVEPSRDERSPREATPETKDRPAEETPPPESAEAPSAEATAAHEVQLAAPAAPVEPAPLASEKPIALSQPAEIPAEQPSVPEPVEIPEVRPEALVATAPVATSTEPIIERDLSPAANEPAAVVAEPQPDMAVPMSDAAAQVPPQAVQAPTRAEPQQTPAPQQTSVPHQASVPQQVPAPSVAAAPAPPAPSPAPLRLPWIKQPDTEVAPSIVVQPRPVVTPESPKLPWLRGASSKAASQLASLAPSSNTPPSAPRLRYLQDNAPGLGTSEGAVSLAASPSQTMPGALVPAPDVATVPPRAAVPYMPLRMHGRGRGAAAAADPVDSGPATSDAPSAPRDPVARIAWGTPEQAQATVRAGGLQLVTVDDQFKVTACIIERSGAWTKAPLTGLARFSNKVRVVDHVPAFEATWGQCAPGEHLAVLVPVSLERRIDQAMEEAARRAGLQRSHVAACFGRLVIEPQGLDFRIDRVEQRSGS